MFNSFGNILRLTSFGESHGKGIGGVIDGFPAGIRIDMDFVQAELNRRRPGQSAITTARKEEDKVEFLSGIFEGKSTGCPIGFIVWNQNQHSNDYDNMKEVYRPSHADYTYKVKYGIRDHRGGGRFSARLRPQPDRYESCPLPGSGKGKGDGRADTQSKRRGRHHRRRSDLRHQRMPHRSGTAGIRQVACRTRLGHAQYQCRQGI